MDDDIIRFGCLSVSSQPVTNHHLHIASSPCTHRRKLQQLGDGRRGDGSRRCSILWSFVNQQIGPSHSPLYCIKNILADRYAARRYPIFTVEAREKNEMSMHAIKTVKSRLMAVSQFVSTMTLSTKAKRLVSPQSALKRAIEFRGRRGGILSRFSSWTIKGLSVGFDLESLTTACKLSVSSLLGSVALTPGAHQSSSP